MTRFEDTIAVKLVPVILVYTEPPPTKVEGFSGLGRLRRKVEIFSD